MHQSSTTRSVRRLASHGVLTALVAAGLAVTALAPAAAAPGQTGWIRAAHLAPDTGKADVLLTPFEGGESAELDGVSYSDVTRYARVPVGLYTIDIRAAGSPASSSPMISRTVRVTEDAAITVVASGEQGDVTAQPVFDDLRPPREGQAKVRLISAVAGAEVTARVDGGPLLAREVTTGSATGYAQVAPQVWSVDVTAGDTGTSARVPVAAGGVYTLLALRDADGEVSLQAVQDASGSGVMPTGGVDTGGGGLAAQDPQDLAALGRASAGLLPGPASAVAWISP